MTYPSYEAPIRTASPTTSLAELVERYRVNESEALGLLHTIAELPGPPPFTNLNADSVDFLRLVGREGKNRWEPREKLRSTARHVIFRIVLPKLGKDWGNESRIVLIRDILEFFSENQDHTPNSDRERANQDALTKFLGKCWVEFSYKNMAMAKPLVGASVNANYLEYLEPTAETLQTLYDFLRPQLPTGHGAEHFNLPVFAIDPLKVGPSVEERFPLSVLAHMCTHMRGPYFGDYLSRMEKLLILRASLGP